MATSPIGSTYTPPAYQEKPTSSSSLDKNGFLKMLTEQIKNQDPQSNQDPSQYFNTISQMTMVEQMTNLATESSRTSAQGLLGKTVTYMDKTGQTITGTVDAVDLTNSSAPRLTVGGVDGIDPAVLQKVS
jgi:flagellar basal-body rod modification protein FlgD